MTSPHQPVAPNSLSSESPAEKPNRLLWWLHPKVALPLTLLGLLLVTPFLYRGYRISRIPEIGEARGGLADAGVSATSPIAR